MVANLTLSRSARRGIFLRSFLLQASWNFEQMMGLGALFVLAPLLQQIYQGEELKQAYARHLSYFNSHPFAAPLILSGVAQLEVNGATAEETIEFRQLLMAPCAAIGDALFWGGLRPLAAVLAMFFAIYGSLLAPIVLLIVFNIPHLLVRVIGLNKGCDLGYDIVDFLASCRLPDLAIRLKQAALFLLGALCALLMAKTLTSAQLSWGWFGMIVPVVAILGWFARRQISPLLLVLSLVAIIMALHCFC